jgi:hypothetical protein
MGSKMIFVILLKIETYFQKKWPFVVLEKKISSISKKKKLRFLYNFVVLDSFFKTSTILVPLGVLKLKINVHICMMIVRFKFIL